MSQSSQNDIVEGWVWGPNTRGTLGILWTSVLTIILCSSNALYLNIPPRHWTRWRRFLQKTVFFSLSILGPEFVLQIAFAQWASARRSVEAFTRIRYADRSDVTYNPWTMRHAFLADMGCFRLDTEDRRDYPLDAKQVHYLVERGYVDYQQIGIHKSEIDDRDKGDGILLLITVVQILWFSFNLNGRAWFGNSLTPLELTAIASVLPMLVTFWLWRQKPLGVGFTITLKPTVSIGEMREAHERHVKELGIPSREKCAMPLDCAGRELFPWNRYRTREQGTLGTRKVKIPDDNFPSLPKCAITLCMVFQGLYAGIHVWGWDLFFPTDLERTLWRYGSLILAGCLGGFWLNHFFTYFCRERLFAARRRSPGRSAQTELGKKTEDPENGLDTSTSSQVIGLLPILALAICYVVVRMFIIVESFASLRMLPEDAFKLIRLNDILPSFT